MKSIDDFTSKRFLITGASSGIGKSICNELDALGAELIMVDINIDALENIQGSLSGNNHKTIGADITSDNFIEILIDTIIGLKFDGFLHSAGIARTIPLRSMKVNDYLQTWNVNLNAGFSIVNFLINGSYLNDYSSIIFISSVMGILGERGKIAYSASKGAIISAIRSMVTELSETESRINAILPGVTQTEMVNRFFSKISNESKNEITTSHPLGLGLPIDIANMCIFLLSAKSRWITGTSIVIDGGYSIK